MKKRFLAWLMSLCLLSAQAQAAMTLPSALSVIGEEAFRRSAAAEVIVPEGATEIRSLAFADSALSAITLPESLTFIAADAFQGCGPIDVTAPRGSYAYLRCVELGLITAAGGYAYALRDGYAVLTGYIGTDKALTLPAEVDGYAVRAIGDGAFAQSAVTSVILPDSVTAIGASAFAGCSALTAAQIPASVTAIGENAFDGCAKLTIKGKSGSYAETYAKHNSIPFSALPTEIPGFGTVTSIKKVSWNYDDKGASIFPKGKYANVLDIKTGKVFRIYRWSGGNHADCVPAHTDATRTMCEIVGFPYSSKSPTSSQLSKIIQYGKSGSGTNYSWPDWGNNFGSGKDIGSAWDRRPALLRVSGTTKAYAVSIYGYPHGFEGDDSFSRATFPNGELFYAANNYYGMMCIHFVGSRTHTGATPDAKHQAAIEEAYAAAKKKWPEVCK